MSTYESVTQFILHSPATYIIGVDEVGLGAWAGPLTVGGVVMMKGWGDPEVVDSKKVSRRQRERLLVSKIVPAARFTTVESATSREIDECGVHAALRRCIQDVFSRCFSVVNGDAVGVLDGVEHGFMPIDAIVSLPKADALIPAVSAASILAKVTRDEYMYTMDDKYPGYAFKSHVGYGTPKHQIALTDLGPCEIHRRSYRPIKQAIAEYKKAW